MELRGVLRPLGEAAFEKVVMTTLELYDAALVGDLERVTLLVVEQGVDKNQVGGEYGETLLSAAVGNDHFAVVQYLVEQGADMDKADNKGDHLTPLHYATALGHLELVRYLLEQGADRDKSDIGGWTSLHYAAANSERLEIAKLLMSYGADLNAKDNDGDLPIDFAATEEMKQAIRDEPRRRMDHGHKRATEQDRHPNAAASASAQQEDEEEEEEPSNKRPRLDDGVVTAVGKVEEEDESSEPSSDGEDD